MDTKIVFDFSKISVDELDKAMKSSRFSPEVRKAISAVSGLSETELAAMPVPQYKKLVADFTRAAFSPMDSESG